MGVCLFLNWHPVFCNVAKLHSAFSFLSLFLSIMLLFVSTLNYDDLKCAQLLVEAMPEPLLSLTLDVG